MNIRYFKEVVVRIQQIWNNVHEATIFLKTTKNHLILQVIL